MRRTLSDSDDEAHLSHDSDTESVRQHRRRLREEIIQRRGQTQQTQEATTTTTGIYAYHSVAVINEEEDNGHTEEETQAQGYKTDQQQHTDRERQQEEQREKQEEGDIQLPVSAPGSLSSASSAPSSLLASSLPSRFSPLRVLLRCLFTLRPGAAPHCYTSAKVFTALFAVVIVLRTLLLFAGMDFIGVPHHVFLPLSHGNNNATANVSNTTPTHCPPPPSVLVLAADNRFTTPPWWSPKKENAVFEIDYVTWASMTHRLYSMYQGYDYYVWQGGALDRTAVWAKLYAALHLLPHYDYIISLDSDAGFTNVTQSLTEFLDLYAPDMKPGSNSPVSIAFSVDAFSHLSGGCVLNAGVFIIKNTPSTMPLLQAWWNGPDVPFNRTHALTMIPDSKTDPDWLYKYCLDLISGGRVFALPVAKTEWPAEQLVLNALVLCDKRYSSSVAALPSSLLMTGDFIAHKVSAFPQERVPHLRAAAIDAVFHLIAKPPTPQKALTAMNQTR